MHSGYARTSARQIAKQAGVSHTLVNYYFGSKEALFAEVVALNLRPSSIVAQAFAGSGRTPLARARQILLAALTLWDQPEVRGSLTRLIGGAMSDDALRATVGEFVVDEVLTKAQAQLGGRDAQRRARALLGAMAGIIFTRYVMRIEPFASMTQAEVISTFAPSLTVHLR